MRKDEEYIKFKKILSEYESYLVREELFPWDYFWTLYCYLSKYHRNIYNNIKEWIIYWEERWNFN